MRYTEWRKHFLDAADHLQRICHPLVLPVDLSRLAAARGVRQIRFRRMPVDGALKVGAEGFEIQLRANKERSVPVSSVDSCALSARDRFSYAHELAHTFLIDAELRPIRPQPRKEILESLCNFGAGCLLMPAFLVEREIGRAWGFNCLEVALNLAETAGVSATVAVRRLNEFDHLKVHDFALILLEPNTMGKLVTIGAFLSGAMSARTKPKLYAEPPTWVSRLVPGVFDGTGAACRTRYDHKWEYVSRALPNPKRPTQWLAEIRLESSST